ncbi:MAG: hypothetical protein ACRC4M_03535 [Mycoplasma sp.]
MNRKTTKEIEFAKYKDGTERIVIIKQGHEEEVISSGYDRAKFLSSKIDR